MAQTYIGCPSKPLYRIHYRDEDPGCPVFTCVLRAYDREHAELRFLDAPDGEGWVILKIEEVTR